MKVLKNGKGQWYYDFTFKDQRYRVITGMTKAETQEAMHERLNKLRRELHGLESGAKPPEKPVMFDDFAKDFIELYSKKNRRPKTVQSHENSIAHLKPYFGGKALSEIKPEMIERYKAERSEKLSKASVNREIACLKKMFSLAVEWGKVESNPAAKVRKFKEYFPDMRILSTAEIARLLDCSKGNLKPILTIALNTGMRRNEILGLRWANVNFVNRFILIEDKEAKSGRSRKVPMNGAVINALKLIPRKSRFVFFNPETMENFKSIRTAFLGACKKAKVSGLRLHDLRHTAATKMIEAGVDIVTVSKILGHASIEITYQRYCHPTPESMQTAVDKLGALLENSIKPVKNPVIERVKPKGEISASESYLYN